MSVQMALARTFFCLASMLALSLLVGESHAQEASVAGSRIAFGRCPPKHSLRLPLTRIASLLGLHKPVNYSSRLTRERYVYANLAVCVSLCERWNKSTCATTQLAT